MGNGSDHIDSPSECFVKKKTSSKCLSHVAAGSRLALLALFFLSFVSQVPRADYLVLANFSREQHKALSITDLRLNSHWFAGGMYKLNSTLKRNPSGNARFPPKREGDRTGSEFLCNSRGLFHSKKNSLL